MHNHEPEDYECPCCNLANGKENEYNLQRDVIYKNGEVLAYVSPKWWVNNPGNVIVFPRAHIENIYDISDKVLCEINKVGKKIAIALKEAYKCDGISFRQHNEPAGNQSVFHFHLHVFPRWRNDDLYLNTEKSRFVLSDDKLPYVEKLRDYFLRLKK